MGDGVKTRPSVRDEQAANTRRRILEAAGVVLAEQGFGGARIEDIAAHAGVAVPTVYKAFANKANLLVGALNVALSGDETDRIDQQRWFVEQLDEPDPVRQLQLVARNARRIYERAAPLLAVLRAAALADEELAATADGVTKQRLQRSRTTARALHTKAADRLRLSRPATAMTLWSLTEPALFTAVTSTGHSADDYESWLGDVLVRTLLD